MIFIRVIVCFFFCCNRIDLIIAQRLRIEDRLTDLNNKPIDVSECYKINHPEQFTWLIAFGFTAVPDARH